MSKLSEKELAGLLAGDHAIIDQVLSPMDQLVVRCAVLGSEIIRYKELLGGLSMTPKWRRPSRLDEILQNIADTMRAHNQVAHEHNSKIQKGDGRAPIPDLKIDLQRLAKMYR